ncbi:MAG: signal peptidase II [Methylohalobius sp.]|nr:signal peptidase II [Methylohalobius sp.]
MPEGGLTPKKALGISLAALVVILDQLSKQWVTTGLSLGESIEVLPGLRFTYVRNPGAAFSFLAEAGGWQRWFFMGLAAVASAAIIVWLWRLKNERTLEGVGLCLVLGGALGNLIDRARFGYVIDFVDVYYRQWHWPAFNIADAAITLGVTLLVWGELKSKRGG